MNTESIILDLPVVIKASSSESGERRVSVEASNEELDKENDMILQKALLDSSDYFIKNGHFDLDHISELGHRMGIPNPDRYVIGYPTTVKDLGEKRTGVEGTIFKNKDGSVDPSKFVYDAFWCSLQTDPPARWKASIFGRATEIDASGEKAPRHLVKAIRWSSLAFTKKPVNDAIKGEARIITAKAFVDMVKSGGMVPFGPFPGVNFDITKARLLEEYNGNIKVKAGGNVPTYGFVKEHFQTAFGMDEAKADLCTAALCHYLTHSHS